MLTSSWEPAYPLLVSIVYVSKVNTLPEPADTVSVEHRYNPHNYNPSKAYQREYYLRHREARLAYWREYYQKHREKKLAASNKRNRERTIRQTHPRSSPRNQAQVCGHSDEDPSIC